MRTLSLLLILACWSSLSLAEIFTFKLKGVEVGQLSLEDLKKKVPEVTIAVNELHESTNLQYKAIPFYPLLKAIYGDKLAKADEVLFTCLDGYQPSIPLKRFETHQAFLTYQKESGDYKFTDKVTKKEVEYGPYYLVWENLKDAALIKEGNENWPYQLITVDLIQFSDKFPNLAPPANAKANVKDGFLAFRSQCLQCHTINGEGGGKGVELNWPASVTEYLSDKWLTKWISDPTSLRYNTSMPQVNPELPNRDKVIKDIIAYLKVMAKNKKKPIPPK